jgi:hypothetical protein
MMMLIISLLVGMALGQRFKVLILVPAIAAAIIVSIAAGIARDDDIWSIVLLAVVAATGLQIGYLGGIAIRIGLAAARANRLRLLAPRTSATV